MTYFKTLSSSLLFALSALVSNTDDLKPIMVDTNQQLFQSKFDQSADLNSPYLQVKDNTRWTINNGVLEGLPSPIEYQKTTPGHNGSKPLIIFDLKSIRSCLSFKIKFSGLGIEYQGAGFGITRYGSAVKLNALGTVLTADHHHLILMQDRDFKLEDGKWYTCMMEFFDDELLVQFKGGPTLYGQHPSIYAKHGSIEKLTEEGLPSQKLFGFFGAESSKTEIDDLKLWSAKDEQQSNWEQKKVALIKAHQSKYPNFESKLDRKMVDAKLKALQEKDSRVTAISKLRSKEQEIKKLSKAAKKKS